MKAERGDEALRRFRLSQPATDYFITTNLAARSPAGFIPATKDAIRLELEAIESAGHWRIRGATVMPDHLHLLVTLGGNLALSRAIARLKAKTRNALARQGLQWQPNYYEHRLRAREDPRDILRYIFLNPFRAGLISTAERYPWFWLGTPEREWFEPCLDDGRPFAEWLR